MTSLDIEIIVMQHLGIRRNLIVLNVSWGITIGGRSLHECDLLVLSPNGYATEIEIKVSKADIVKDKQKLHGHVHNAIANLYFAVPDKLRDFALANIPARAGLICIGSKNTKPTFVKAKQPKRKKNAIKCTDKDRLNLARLGAMRILGLKQTIRTHLQNG